MSHYKHYKSATRQDLSFNIACAGIMSSTRYFAPIRVASEIQWSKCSYRFPTPKCRRGPVIIKRRRCCDRRMYIDGSFREDLFGEEERGEEEATAVRRAALCLHRCIESPTHEIPGNEEQIISSDGADAHRFQATRGSGLVGARGVEGTTRGPRPLLMPNIDHPASFAVFRFARSLWNSCRPFLSP